MFKLKQSAFMAVLVGGFAVVATLSIFPRTSIQEQGLPVVAQIDTMELMSSARNLPVHTADGAF